MARDEIFVEGLKRNLRCAGLLVEAYAFGGLVEFFVEGVKRNVRGANYLLNPNYALEKKIVLIGEDMD